jgi:hypothetical protein
MVEEMIHTFVVTLICTRQEEEFFFEKIVVHKESVSFWNTHVTRHCHHEMAG